MPFYSRLHNFSPKVMISFTVISKVCVCQLIPLILFCFEEVLGPSLQHVLSVCFIFLPFGKILVRVYIEIYFFLLLFYLFYFFTPCMQLVLFSVYKMYIVCRGSVMFIIMIRHIWVPMQQCMWFSFSMNIIVPVNYNTSSVCAVMY